jgi:hypothetical protein
MPEDREMPQYCPVRKYFCFCQPRCYCFLGPK